ncbi:MAG: ABC transporter ATP-binding protein [Planctomycetes bacterium]|nr:ABC transporter ATP-binding protein [Planctomycetota bacterium]
MPPLVPPEETLPKQDLGLLAKRLLPYYLAHRAALLRAVVLLLGVILLGLVAPLVLGQVVDIATGQGQPVDRPFWVPVSPDARGLVILSLLFVGAVVARFTFEALLGVTMAKVGISTVMQLKEDLVRKILTQDAAFFRDMPPGRLIARVESDTEALKDLFSVTTLQLLRAGLSFLAIFGCMFLFDRDTTLLLAPGLLVLALMLGAYLRVVRRYFHRSRRLLAAITGHVAEYVQGIEVVRHHDYGPRAESDLDELQKARYKNDVFADYLNYGFWGVFGFCEIGSAALVLGVGASKVAAGVMTVGSLIVFLEYLRLVFEPIRILSEFVAQVQRGLVAAARIFGILSTEPETGESEDASPDVAWLDALRFEDVHFAYPDPEHEGQLGQPVLQGINLTIPRGKTVALVGPSGGGKSTLVKLLLRYHQPTSGRISLDGNDLNGLQRDARRRRVGYVPQDVFLFPGSLADNLSVFDRSSSPDQIAEACRAARAERLLEALPGGLQATIAERGGNLSHGERQLLSLARALLEDPELLVLDEATSSVDPETEAAIQTSLERLLKGRTALIVAHRLSTIRQSDEIVYVANGQVVERGTHDELWERGGAYRQLAQLQLGAGGGA